MTDWHPNNKQLTVNFGALTEGLEFVFHVPNGITPQDSHNKEPVGKKKIKISTGHTTYASFNITRHCVINLGVV